MEALIEQAIAYAPFWLKAILMLLGTVVVLAQIIVPLTPSKKDDEILEKGLSKIPKNLLTILLKFAVIKKK